MELDLDNRKFSLSIDGADVLTDRLYRSDGTPLGPFMGIRFGNMIGLVGGNPAPLGAFTAYLDNVVVTLP